PRFAVDCTNFVSQCLFSGGAPMVGEPDVESGWWCRPDADSWSFSWSVSHSLYWYLRSAGFGLKGRLVNSPTELELGDLIFYSFNGDHRWDHTTIVVGFDSRGNPLVNAHTDNSRHRFWSYTDSVAWTSKTKYAFFQIE